MPGHERFIHNMLAGVGGIDVALLVVAADEGVMPQTREHVAILDLLGIASGVVALTKRDLVDDEWLELVQADVEELLAATRAGGRAADRLSRRSTGDGLDELSRRCRSCLSRERPRRVTGRPRLPIDRIFTVAGFGTVVTGTLIDGELRLGQELEIQPGGTGRACAGLQSHKRKVEAAGRHPHGGQPVGGGGRGPAARPGADRAGGLRPTRAVDARLRLIADAPRPLAHNAQVTFHTARPRRWRGWRCSIATSSDRARAPGRSCACRTRWRWRKGDLFIVRLPSPSMTLGGGRVVEPQPARHRRFQAQVLDQLEVLAQGHARGDPAGAARGRASRPTSTPCCAGPGCRRAQPVEVVAELVRSGEVIALDGTRAALSAQTLVVSAPGWDRLVGRVSAALAAYHQGYPLRRGMPKEELRTRLVVESRLFTRSVQRLLTEGTVTEACPLLSLAEHSVTFTLEQEQQVAALLELLRGRGLPRPIELTWKHASVCRPS